MGEQAEYVVEKAFAQTWTVYMVHVVMVSDLVNRGLAKNASEAARMLIEAGYEKFQAVIVQSS